MSIISQRTTCGYRVVEGPPKSAASRRDVALDRRTVAVLRAHQRRQRTECASARHPWRPDGYVFTRPDGTPMHPNSMTKRLRYLIRQVGLPPVRLHDLRHGAASLAHTAGADLKTVQDQLGHASIVLTADTYTSVLPAAQHRAAEATARLVLTAARGARAKMTGRHQPDGVTRPPGRSITPTPDSRPGGGQPAGQSTSMRRSKRPKGKAASKQPQGIHRPHRTSR
ncbi:MAG TPA: tyrosine-type recombinase/integrase [Micromonosporaceae bacterium]|nr:tyrosine-type recombinase/integrase [Micromonosporaceae bacterium]